MTQETTNEPVVTLDMLKAAFAMRAKAYAHMFDVLREAYGADRAVELIAESTRRLGQDMGKKFAHLGPDNLPGLKDAFIGGIPCSAQMFAPEIKKCDDESLEIQFHRCPLKDTWTEQGRNEEDLELLCKAAGAIDGGLFTEAGFTFKGETWTKGKTGCCLLRVEPGANAG